MRAMILAAGFGKRMRSLTADTPKPLLKIGARTLIEHQINRLVSNGIRDIVINHHYLGEQIEALLADGSSYGAAIRYSPEPVLLQWAGGIIKALPLLEDDSFIVVNADVWTDFPFASLQPVDGTDRLAHLVMVKNPPHHPRGDFCLDKRGRLHANDLPDLTRYTFSGISVLHRDLFDGHPIQPIPMLPLISHAMAQDKVSGEIYPGVWNDIGTPEILRELNDIVEKVPGG